MQNATLAGGVSIGMSCSYNVDPWVPVLIGGLAGVLSSVGYGKLAGCMEVGNVVCTYNIQCIVFIVQCTLHSV